MKHNATLMMFGALCLFGCASEAPVMQSGPNTMAGAPATVAGAPGATGAVAGNPSASAAGSNAGASNNAGMAAPAQGGAGASSAQTPAAGSGASSDSAGTMAAAAAAGSGGAAAMAMAGAGAPSNDAPPKGSFLAVYTLALRDMCMSCHAVGGIFGSPDLSSPDRAYESLVDKDASTMAPGACGGMGKLVTPGNCETSLIYNKITQMTPICGRRMPLSSDAMPQLVPQEGIDALCEWIMAGAKKDM